VLAVPQPVDFLQWVGVDEACEGEAVVAVVVAAAVEGEVYGGQEVDLDVEGAAGGGRHVVGGDALVGVWVVAVDVGDVEVGRGGVGVELVLGGGEAGFVGAPAVPGDLGRRVALGGALEREAGGLLEVDGACGDRVRVVHGWRHWIEMKWEGINVELVYCLAIKALQLKMKQID